MIMTRQLQSTVRLLIAAIAVAGLAVIGGAAAGSAQAAGLTNCTEMSTSKPRSGCWEDVWVGGAEHRMVFATGWGTQFKGKVPDDLDAFYVIAPQDDPPQSLNASFRHDHVVRDIRTPEPWRLQHPVARLLRPLQRVGHRQRCLCL